MCFIVDDVTVFISFSYLSVFIRTMDGVNEVGEVKVSRLQMQDESENKAAPDHKVEKESQRFSFLVALVRNTAEVASCHFFYFLLVIFRVLK